MADDENEMMLELSIGGIFENLKKPNESMRKDNRIDDLNMQPKVEIEHLRRRKREEKLKKTVDFGSCGSVSGPFVENKEWLNAQIVRRNDEPVRKKEKIGSLPEKVVDGDVNCVFRPMACRSFKPYQGNMKGDGYEIDGGGRCCCKLNLNGGAMSAYSDGQCSSLQGGATDDSRSNSSNSQLDQQPASTSTASGDPFDPSDQPTTSSKQTISTTKLTDSNTHESSIMNPHSKPETTSQGQSQQASLLARMPCVSTTGNGPNGKTVSGFLYRYTKNEVSIVCVCHGRSFSPAGFVEHAGGVDITHPLKHITIFPAAFAS